MRWQRRLAAELATGLFAILAVSALLFAAAEGIGDPLVAVVSAEATDAERAAVAAQLGLDQSVGVRLARHLLGVLTGDFGLSWRLERPALEVVADSYPFSLALAGLALPIGLAGGILLALGLTLTAIATGGRKAALLPLLLQAVPGFVAAIVLLQLFAVEWRLLPSSGYAGPASMLLPALLIGGGLAVKLGTVLHERLLEIWQEPYVRLARAKGLPAGLLVRRHLLRPAAGMLLSYASIQLGYLLGGAIVIESVFGYPGVGRLAVSALVSRDLPLLNACLAAAAGAFVLVRLAAELLHLWLDPRLRASRGPSP